MLNNNDYKSTPIYQKAQEIFNTVKLITDLIPEDNELLMEIRSHLLVDAMTISAKLAGAAGVKLYDIKMENATFIRKAARDIMVGYHSLKLYGFEHTDYYKMVRRQVEEFRLLFIEWVASFDIEEYLVDDWGLFNPPGIEPDREFYEEDLDDDLDLDDFLSDFDFDDDDDDDF